MKGSQGLNLKFYILTGILEDILIAASCPVLHCTSVLAHIEQFDGTLDGLSREELITSKYQAKIACWVYGTANIASLLSDLSSISINRYDDSELLSEGFDTNAGDIKPVYDIPVYQIIFYYGPVIIIPCKTLEEAIVGAERIAKSIHSKPNAPTSSRYYCVLPLNPGEWSADKFTFACGYMDGKFVKKEYSLGNG